MTASVEVVLKCNGLCSETARATSLLDEHGLLHPQAPEGWRTEVKVGYVLHFCPRCASHRR